ncbi:DUF255 domain-containing protein [Haloferula sp.]|uniref:DUF255 domain-containing protein n=1 Tax=Haloferula sp. TaxID=2497595 RepID=UPI003C795098
MKNTAAILTATTAILLVGCSKPKTSAEEDSKPPPELVPEIQKNRLSAEPSTFLSYAANSKVNWQPWTPEVLEYAKKARRMILVVVGSARYSGCFETLEALEKNPALVSRINEEYVPVLTDIDLTRETGLLAYNLSSESRAPISFPFVMLLSPEGNPVTWHSLNFSSSKEIRNFFDNSLEVIGRLWDDSPDYVTEDSASKAEFRRNNLPDPDEEVPDLAERQQRYQAAMRQLESFYDEDVSSLSGSGGLFPFGIFDTLTLAQFDTTIPEEQRKKYGDTLESFVETLLSSAMVDVLDGGIHPARRGSSWNLVMGRRDCSTQARAGRIFARMYQLYGYPGTLEAAIAAVRFAEERYQTPSGLFCLSEKPQPADSKSWLWMIDQISSVLTEDEFKVWEIYSQLSEIGNLPSEADPDRTYFRLNSLAAALSLEEVAAASDMELEQVQALIESGRKKLRKAREAEISAPSPDTAPSALASFRMVSAYAALYAATKNPEWKEKAVALGKASRKQFLANLFLNERPDAEPEGASDGRAFSYAVAVQAGLDLGAITLEDEWYSWAQDLSTLLAEHFVTEDGRLLEVRKVSQVVDIDYEDRMMIFDDSTAGLVQLNLQRLKALGFRTPPALAAWLNSVPPVERFPIVFTDALLAISHEWNHSVINAGPTLSDELAEAITTLPLQLFVRRRGNSEGVTITPQEGPEISDATAADIEKLLNNP